MSPLLGSLVLPPSLDRSMERPPEPAPAPDELQAGALWANNIARIAALAVDQKAAQGDAKDAQKKKAAKEAERAKEKEKTKAPKPEDVKAETIVEELVRWWNDCADL